MKIICWVFLLMILCGSDENFCYEFVLILLRAKDIALGN